MLDYKLKPEIWQAAGRVLRGRGSIPNGVIYVIVIDASEV
jgi:hypothetical protein